MTAGQEWLVVGVCLAIAIAVKLAFTLNRRRRLRARTERTRPLSSLPKIGRCQHCQQIRPVFHYNGKFDNGEPIWSTPCPEPWAVHGVWLCARDWSEAETCRVNGIPFHVEHDLEVWYWRENPTRIFTPDGELLTQGARDLQTCEAILATTEETTQ